MLITVIVVGLFRPIFGSLQLQKYVSTTIKEGSWLEIESYPNVENLLTCLQLLMNNPNDEIKSGVYKQSTQVCSFGAVQRSYIPGGYRK